MKSSDEPFEQSLQRTRRLVLSKNWPSERWLKSNRTKRRTTAEALRLLRLGEEGFGFAVIASSGGEVSLPFAAFASEYNRARKELCQALRHQARATIRPQVGFFQTWGQDSTARDLADDLAFVRVTCIDCHRRILAALARLSPLPFFASRSLNRSLKRLTRLTESVDLAQHVSPRG